jgi:hypothetical protein
MCFKWVLSVLKETGLYVETYMHLPFGLYFWLKVKVLPFAIRNSTLKIGIVSQHEAQRRELLGGRETLLLT